MSALLHQPAVLLFTIVLIILFPLADTFVYARLQTALHVHLWNMAKMFQRLAFAVVLLICCPGMSVAGDSQTVVTL